MLTPWQERSHRRFSRQFLDLLEIASQRHHGVNRWLSFERLSVYVRISQRVLEPATSRKIVRVIDIANVSTDESYQHKGMFTRLVNKIHALTDMPIFLENTHPEFAMHLLDHHGWKFIRSNMGVSYDLVHYHQ